MLLDRAEERGVGGGVVECAARFADHADGAKRKQHGDRTDGEIGLFRDDPAEFCALGGGRAHERDLRIVLIEGPAGVFRRHGPGWAEVHHVEAAGRDDRGHAVARGGFETRGAGREHAARQFIRPFGGGEIKDARDETSLDQRLHGASAGAGGVEHEHLVASGLDDLARVFDRLGGVAEH